MGTPILLVSLTMALATTVAAHNTPKDFVDAHNRIRAEVGIPPLVWNDALAAYAHAYSQHRATDCAMEHSVGGPYGENLAAGSWNMSAEEAVNMWYEEKHVYDVASNRCLCPDDELCCFHYTQIVWNTTACVGCGTAKCSNGWTFITCSYDPPGNFFGVRPF